MMISHEQALRAAHELRQGTARLAVAPTSSVSPDVVDAAVHRAAVAPEIRVDRVIHARHMLDGGLPDSRDIAERILHRALGDAVR